MGGRNRVRVRARSFEDAPPLRYDYLLGQITMQTLEPRGPLDATMVGACGHCGQRVEVTHAPALGFSCNCCGDPTLGECACARCGRDIGFEITP